VKSANTTNELNHSGLFSGFLPPHRLQIDKRRNQTHLSEQRIEIGAKVNKVKLQLAADEVAGVRFYFILRHCFCVFLCVNDVKLRTGKQAGTTHIITNSN